jgi:hypothetical protein
VSRTAGGIKAGALLGALAALTGAAPPLAAQQQFKRPRVHALELTFAAGYFHPIATGGAVGGLPLTRKGSWAAAVKFAGYAPNGWLGAELSSGYAPERVSQGGMGSRRTNLLYGTLRVVAGRTPRKGGVSWLAGAGIGVLRRANSVTDFDRTTSHFGGSASLAFRIPIDEEVGIRLDLEDLIYRADFGSGSKLRNDLVLTAGLGISW